METRIEPGLDALIRRTFALPEVPLNEISPLALAYLGDCVYDLILKTKVLQEENVQVGKMHTVVSRYVNAKAQSEIMRILQPQLTAEEHTVFKSGRNTKSVSPARHQTITDYRRATGFEALVGYLYLAGRYERLLELVRIGVEHIKQKEKEHDR